MSWDMLPQTQAINLKNNDLCILNNDGQTLVQGDLENHFVFVDESCLWGEITQYWLDMIKWFI